VSGTATLQGLIDASGASAGQVKFPASPNLSANVNTLDAYVESDSWTPVFTFTTPGNQNIVYSSQSGFYTRIGRFVMATFGVVTSTFTHTTAAGTFAITGLPHTPAATNFEGTVEFSGLTLPAGTSSVTLRVQASSTALVLVGTPGATLFAVGQHVSGTNVALIGTLVYHI
jgi:hypothetical protein